MSRPYNRVEYKESNGFQYPYWDIKVQGDPPPSPSPTPSISPSVTPSITPSSSAPPSPTPSVTPSATPPYDYDRNFEFTVDTRKTNANSSGTSSFGFSFTNSSFPVPYQNQTRIYWGDGNSDLVSTTRNHTYSTPGIYTIRIEINSGNVLSDGVSIEFRRSATPGSEGDAVKVIGSSIVSPEYALNKSGGFNDFEACRNFVSFTGQATQLTLSGTCAAIFRDCNSFTGGISNWNMSGVTNLGSTFKNCVAFNEDISGWDTGNVSNMNSTFYSATTFNRNLGSWDIGSISTTCSSKTGMVNMFGLTNLQTANYDQILIGWASQTPPSCVNLFGVPCGYSSTGQASRNTLTSTYQWIINDGGLVP